MRNSAYTKNIIKSILESKGRFISIIALMMLGSFAYVGLQSTAPAMEDRARAYFSVNNTMDLMVSGTYGFSKEDIEELEKLENAEVEFSYLSDVNDKKTGKAIRVFSKEDSQNISNYELVEGYKPKKNDEIVISNAYKGDYKLGDKFEVETKEDSILKNKEYTIVGFANSSEIISINTLGASGAGDGSLKGYAYVLNGAFVSDSYSISRIRYEELKELSPFTEEYKIKLEIRERELENILSDNGERRISLIKQEKQEEVDKAKEVIEEAKVNMVVSKVNYENAKNFMSRDDGEKIEQELSEAQAKIDESEKEVQSSQEKIDSLKLAEYTVYNRKNAPGGEGYLIFESAKDSLKTVSNIFPIVLYAVAAMVTLTGMTRFVNDERTNSGLFRALGYSNKQILMKFLVYGFLATLIGTSMGVVLGSYLLPDLVADIVMNPLTLGSIDLMVRWKYVFFALGLGFFASILPAYIVANKELRNQPASLLRVKAPAKASKILLEKVTFIWSRLSFTRKVTARNIFRYKQRMFMTIFGVAGSVALLFAGLGIQSSVGGVVDSQFGKTMTYDVLVIEKDKKEEKDKLADILNEENIEKTQSIYYENIESLTPDKEKININLMASENGDFKSMINLKSDTGEEILLPEDSAVISPKLASLYNLEVGDFYTYIDKDKREISVKVGDIAEIYAGHHIYMTAEYYKKIYNKSYEINAHLIDLKNGYEVELFSSRLLTENLVEGSVQNTALISSTNSIVESLNNVMLILVLVSISLGVVILYNLTTINVAERIRELCTIKVLGFYNREVTMYIYRETISLSIVGIIVGLFFGKVLHKFIIEKIGSTNLIFNPNVDLYVYLVSIVAILGIVIVLGIIVNKKLKTVDMLEALKSLD